MRSLCHIWPLFLQKICRNLEIAESVLCPISGTRRRPIMISDVDPSCLYPKQCANVGVFDDAAGLLARVFQHVCHFFLDGFLD